MLSEIDKRQIELIRERGPKYSMQVCLDMINAVRSMYEVQARKDNPNLTGRALQLAVARRMYALEPETLKMIDRLEAADGHE